MRAMVLDKPGPAEGSPLAMRDAATPAPAAGEVRVKVRICGLCHTDLHTVEGDIPLHKRPVIPGPQVVGVIDALGSGVTVHREGDRVRIAWLHSTDGTCEYCCRGLENLCVNGRFTGYDVDGGYAEYSVV